MPAVVLSPGTVRQIADAIVDRAALAQQDERLLENRKATGLVEYRERTEREMIVAAFLDFFDLLRGRIEFIEQRRQHQMPIHARAAAGHCISLQQAREMDNARRDADQERRCREQGRRDLDAEREQRRADAKRREDDARRLREDMVGFRAAGVFLVAEETRQRSHLDGDYATQLAAMRRRFAEEEALSMRGVAEREAREERARQEVLAAAKKEAAALEEKRMAEVQRRQHKLLSKCTHARNGQSVFLQPYPKKMCLLCRIKFDPLSGTFIPMEGKK